MRALMVHGCTSWAGKSLLTTVLCRWAADLGIDVAPFKGQNMANNARVTPDGEIGVAQWLQARAARVQPSVHHNPVLVKPEADTRSQVVVHGRVDEGLTGLPWSARPPRLWDAIVASLNHVVDQHDLVVAEGAGSPAEVNLTDVVNGRVATRLDAAVLLVADIDRGGAFAHLFGTWSLVDDDARARLVGFVLNRFRGDPALLDPGPAILEQRTGVPTIGLVPMLRHALPDEDGARTWGAPADVDAPRVAVLAAPAVSNLDEFAALAQVAHVVWARSPADLAGADLLVLPGSKHVAEDRRWLARTGLDAAVVAAAGSGRRVLGICGGAMLLGARVRDPTGVEGGTPSDVAGLGLLPLATELRRPKLLRHGPVVLADPLPAPWAPLAGRRVEACYEIRHGRVEACGAAAAPAVGAPSGEVLGWADANVLATTTHGLLEDPDVLAALLHVPAPPPLDVVIDELTAAVVPHLDTDLLRTTIGA